LPSKVNVFPNAVFNFDVLGVAGFNISVAALNVDVTVLKPVAG
jgi:hypothetical protein